jgi:hypothetical protein
MPRDAKGCMPQSCIRYSQVKSPLSTLWSTRRRVCQHDHGRISANGNEEWRAPDSSRLDLEEKDDCPTYHVSMQQQQHQAVRRMPNLRLLFSKMRFWGTFAMPKGLGIPIEGDRGLGH